MRKRAQEEQPWAMDEMHQALERAQTSEGNQTHRAVGREKFVEKVGDAAARGIERDLFARAPKMLIERRRGLSNFEDRNFRRWRPAFDLTETLWVCCEELGRNFNEVFRPDAIRNQDFVFEAMTHIHAKSLLVVEEMNCLMKGGFADGALTRWRTAYELNVVGSLIIQEGQDLALRYLAHADVQVARDIELDGLDSDDDINEAKRRAAYAISQFGEEIRRHYGWACRVVGKKQPNFEDLERLVAKENGRELYKHVSRHIHSNHRSFGDLLGMSESNDAALLVGPSNSGMTAPLILGSMTLAETTALFLNTKPNFDRGVYALVLLKMAQRVTKIAGAVEQRTLQAARRRKERFKKAL